MMTLAGCSSPPREQTVTGTAALPRRGRTFTVRYVAMVPGVPHGERRLDVWVPVPRCDAQQRIGELSLKTDLPHELQIDPAYGNSVLHVWNERGKAAEVELTYSCARREERALAETTAAAHISRSPAPDDRNLLPDRLGAIDEEIRNTAARLTADRVDTLSKARAIYDYVLEHMAYDKTSPGWGNGDTLRACRVGKGNCTDFHALFISLARAAGIPARFGIGFPVPRDRQSGVIESYHCWAEFWLADAGWVPVDCSEAWKHPDRREFYFGNLDPDRFRLSVGRDIRLPGMRGEPLNYLLNPYAEIDGKPAGPVAREVSFTSEGAISG